MTQRHAKIELDGAGRGRVELDGEQLRGVSGLDLTSQAGRTITRLTVDVPLPGGTAVDARVAVWIRPESARTLVALGWTPPDPIYLQLAAESGDPFVRYREPAGCAHDWHDDSRFIDLPGRAEVCTKCPARRQTTP